MHLIIRRSHLILSLKWTLLFLFSRCGGIWVTQLKDPRLLSINWVMLQLLEGCGSVVTSKQKGRHKRGDSGDSRHMSLWLRARRDDCADLLLWHLMGDTGSLLKVPLRQRQCMYTSVTCVIHSIRLHFSISFLAQCLYRYLCWETLQKYFKCSNLMVWKKRCFKCLCWDVWIILYHLINWMWLFGLFLLFPVDEHR